MSMGVIDNWCVDLFVVGFQASVEKIENQVIDSCR